MFEVGHDDLVQSPYVSVILRGHLDGIGMALGKRGAAPLSFSTI
jgi:hypothetical protein